MDFPSINIQGNIISSEIIDKIRNEDIKYQAAAEFGLDRKTSVRDEIGLAWAAARAFWTAFRLRADRLQEGVSGSSETRNLWIIPLLRELGYDVERAPAYVHPDSGKSYAISHKAANRGEFPIHIMGINDSLDRRRESSGPRLSPHALVQEYLNNTEHVYAMVSNGKYLRLLRDATRLVRISFLEFNLEKMMEEELYSDFAILFRLLHATRMPKQADELEESPIEYYHQESLSSGSRIREKLSKAVENSIKELANGFLVHPANGTLRNRVQSGEIAASDYYLHQLRLVYRFLFLIVIEERNLVYPELKDAGIQKKRKIYYDFYSIERLRKLAAKIHYVDRRKHDLWQGLKATFKLFEQGTYGDKLGIRPLGSGLFDVDALGDLSGLNLDNETLLKVIRTLTYFENEQRQMVRVNYSDLDVEEFGSVYEGLLEYDANFTEVNAMPHFAFVEGKGRSSSGSHYTPEELVKPLIKHSLDYIIEDKLKLATSKSDSNKEQKEAVKRAQEEALLSITVCDVACGSGHILLSAARRIAIELARIRTNEEQPSPTALRNAIRDVIRHCIYGVDKNPLAVELCKVALWLEAHNPGEPLNFLDHHIKCGDSIVGLAHREELEKGIPNEAFKALPGDEKEIASAFLKRNKQERKTREDKAAGVQLAISETIENSVQESMDEYRALAKLSETTPEEIWAKQRAYKKFLDGKGYSWLKAMADTQIAQFFIPKTADNKDRLMTDADFRTMLSGYAGWQSLKTAKAMVVSQQKRFFHWFIEFPEVFQRGGFDCILGNPPFLGGQKLSGSFGDNFLECIKYEFAPIGAVDLVTYFFRRIFGIIKQGGFQSLISTNTLAQGRAREDGLDVIVKQGGTINHAVKSIRWPGIAAVEVALVSITKQAWNGKYVLAGKEVNTITPYLDDAETFGTPFPLKQNNEKSFQGSIVLGKGFILEPNEAVNLIGRDSKNKDVLFPFLNGDDLNNNPDQRPSRWVINFFDWEEEEAKLFPDCYDIIERLVKPEREKVNREVRKKYWWRFAERASRLYYTIAPMKRVMAINNHTRHHVFSFCEEFLIYSHALSVIAMSSYAKFGILSSSMANDWAWWRGSTMGSSTLRYTSSEIFETFPFPQNLSGEIEQRMDGIGEKYNEHRKQLMLKMQLGLTKTYNAFHAKEVQLGITAKTLQGIDKKAIERQYGKEVWNLWNHLQKTEGVCSIEEAIADIVKLRELHVEMDNAVLETYGWSDVQLRHDFYEVDYLPENDRIRFTIHQEARKEILRRLLELNHKIFEEEVKQGLHKEADVKKFYEQKGMVVPEGVAFSDKKGKKSQKQKDKFENELNEPGEGYGLLFD